MSRYSEAYALSLNSPEEFWREQARLIDWHKTPHRILSKDERGVDRWFEGGQLNTAWLALDRHVNDGREHDTALIYDSPVTRTIRKFTFGELLTDVSLVAGALRRSGVAKGDRVVIYMPMVPETLVAMLACARIGAIHSVVFGGFAAPELASRIDDSTPKLILAATCGIEFQTVVPYMPMLERALELASHKPDSVVILQREMARATLDHAGYVDWQAWVSQANPAEAVPIDAWDPLYILYTSGTTGKPKGVLRDAGGHAVALNYSMEAIYGCEAGDVFWAASDVGWVVGHSYIVYGPLLKGCTTVLFEGKPVRTPDAGAFWRVIEEHQVKTFFVAPTAFRAIKKEDPNCTFLEQHNIDTLRYLFVAGERLDPPTWHWLQDHLNVPVIDHWWQTETGWSICANMAGYGLHPMKPGSATLPVPGNDVQIVNDQGTECGANEVGNIVLVPPMPPSHFFTVWGDHKRYVSSYWERFPETYETGDGGFRDDDGYVYILGRTDDVMNVAGHRLSSGELEESVASHVAVAECAVVGASDELKGQVPIGLVVLKDGVSIASESLQEELIQLVRKDVGAFANFKRICIVERLPKTRSGKILRQVVRKMIDDEPYVVPSTIDDPKIIDEIEEEFARVGLLTQQR